MTLLKITLATGVVLLGVALAPTPAMAAAPACEAYTYEGGGSVCDTYLADADRDCPDFARPLMLTGTADPWRLDADKDGWGCEDSDDGTPGGGGSVPTAEPVDDTTEPDTAVPPAEGGGSDAGEALPDTGSSVPLVLGSSGAAMVLVGGAVLAVRRRRIRFQAE